MDECKPLADGADAGHCGGHQPRRRRRDRHRDWAWDWAWDWKAGTVIGSGAVEPVGRISSDVDAVWQFQAGGFTLVPF